MTAIVGIRCQDGIVIGSDSSTTFSSGPNMPTIEQSADKIEIVGNEIIVAGTGAVGLGQRFLDIVKDGWTVGLSLVEGKPPRPLKGLDKSMGVAKLLSSAMIEDMASTFTPKGQFGALVAFPHKRSFQLYEFSLQDFQPEAKEKFWYVSMGCTQHITDSFLALMKDLFWNDRIPNLNEGMLGAVWTLKHAIEVNTGGVNGPIRLAVLKRTSDGHPVAEKLSDADLHEHLEFIQQMKTRIGALMPDILNAAGTDVPEVPKPEEG